MYVAQLLPYLERNIVAPQKYLAIGVKQKCRNDVAVGGNWIAVTQLRKGHTQPLGLQVGEGGLNKSSGSIMAYPP
jgi:hypothetical protein